MCINIDISLQFIYLYHKYINRRLTQLILRKKNLYNSVLYMRANNYVYKYEKESISKVSLKINYSYIFCKNVMMMMMQITMTLDLTLKAMMKII